METKEFKLAYIEANGMIMDANEKLVKEVKDGNK